MKTTAFIVALFAGAGIVAGQSGKLDHEQTGPCSLLTSVWIILIADPYCGSDIAPAPGTWWDTCQQLQKTIAASCPNPNAPASGGLCQRLSNTTGFGLCQACGMTFVPILGPGQPNLAPPYDITSFRRAGRFNKGAAYKAFADLCTEACRGADGFSSSEYLAMNEAVAACACNDGTIPYIDLPTWYWHPDIKVNGTMPTRKVKTAIPKTVGNQPASPTPQGSGNTNANPSNNTSSVSSVVRTGSSLAVAAALTAFAML